MFHLISGQVPFKGATAIMTMAAVIYAQQPLLTAICSCSSGFARIIGKSLRKDLQDRYQSAQEMLNDVETEKAMFEDDMKAAFEAQEEMKKHVLVKHQLELVLLQDRMQIESTDLDKTMMTTRAQTQEEMAKSLLAKHAEELVQLEAKMRNDIAGWVELKRECTTM